MVYDINSIARHAARNSDFETHMWYAYYIISEDQSNQEEKDAYRITIGNIVKAATYFEFDTKKISDLKLSSFVLIMDRIHDKFAKTLDDFTAYTGFFRLCLEILMENNLIDTNPMTQIIADPIYYSKYWP